MADGIADPFHGQSPERVQLISGPLVRVLGQIQFPKIIKIGSEQHIGDFQEAVREVFPFIERSATKSLHLGFGVSDVQGNVAEEVAWHLFDPSKQWRVSLNPSALTLETFAYTLRQEFLDRFRFLVGALGRTIRPTIATRAGFRYVNRLARPEHVQDLEGLVNAALVGLLSAPMRDEVDLSISQAQCATREGRLLVRWGWLPIGATHDPATAPPVNARSWILDIDSFTTMDPPMEGFHEEELIGKINVMADRAYAFFRWSVTDKFIETFRETVE